MYILKPLANEISITTANTVYNSSLVRLLNTSANAVVVTVSTSENINIASFSIGSLSELIVEKDRNNRLQGTGILAVPIAYKGL